MDDDLTKAYCDAWHKSFQKENPFHTVKLNEETKSHIVAGLNAVLDVLMRRSGVAAVAIVDKFIPSCEIQYTEVAFHGLTHGTRLYPPEAIAQLQAKNEALSAEVERLTQDRNEWQESCLMANDNAVREERRRRDMQEERDQLRAQLNTVKSQEPIGYVSRQHGELLIRDIHEDPNDTEEGGYTWQLVAPLDAKGEAVALVDVEVRTEMAQAVHSAIRAEVPGLGPWQAFDADEAQRIVDSLKPITHPEPAGHDRCR